MIVVRAKILSSPPSIFLKVSRTHYSLYATLPLEEGPMSLHNYKRQLLTMQNKENKFMARIGKIARLPRDIRAQLNSRLQDGEEGKNILPWLSSLPQVKRLLAENFGGRAITESNLSDWRKGGYEEWLAHQDMLVQAQELAANRRELEAIAPGRSLTDHLTDAVSFRFGAILAAQGLEFDDRARQQLRIPGGASARPSSSCAAASKTPPASKSKASGGTWPASKSSRTRPKPSNRSNGRRSPPAFRFELIKGERLENTAWLGDQARPGHHQ